MLIVIYLLYVKLSETIHINRLLGGRHLFLLNKAEKSQFSLIRYQFYKLIHMFISAISKRIFSGLYLCRPYCVRLAY
ncbi:hypothetical protein [Kiloniella sp.]|uniref:hypothetical protein n=1 Tax=Kiloniella sp. TaxID=1938587 RepID=UPI003B01E201